MTSHVTHPVASLNDARHALSQRLAEVVREGNNAMQVRLVREGAACVVWVYTKQHHEWHKRDDRAVDATLAEPLREVLDGLLAQNYDDAFTLHKTTHSDRTDYELKFRPETIEPHIKGDLESYLLGCLSHSHHDTGQDSRRRMGFRTT